MAVNLKHKKRNQRKHKTKINCKALLLLCFGQKPKHNNLQPSSCCCNKFRSLQNRCHAKDVSWRTRAFTRDCMACTSHKSSCKTSFALKVRQLPSPSTSWLNGWLQSRRLARRPKTGLQNKINKNANDLSLPVTNRQEKLVLEVAANCRQLTAEVAEVAPDGRLQWQQLHKAKCNAAAHFFC